MDGTATAETFENAARYEPELTERQREVLRLIAAGKTNGEIAEALDMTLAGAKWHVSELLTKLALDSREAAAAYHRWRETPRRRLARRLHGLFSATAFKFGLAGASGVAAVGVGAAVLFAMNNDEVVDHGPAVPGLPFYMETAFTREETGYAYELPHRYWFQNESHQRVERGELKLTRNDVGVRFEDLPPSSGSIPNGTVIRDGSYEWRAGPMYKREPLDKFAASRQSIPGTGLGPLKYGSVEEWLAAVAESGTDNELPSSYELEATKTFLGRPVEVYVRRHLTKHPQAEPAPRRVWVDRERLLVVKTEIMMKTAEGAEIVESEFVTKLLYGQSQPAESFVFIPDPSWVENVCEPADFGHPLNPPAPFLSVPGRVDALGDVIPRAFGATVAEDGTCHAWRHDYGSIRDQSQPIVLFLRQEAHNLDSVFGSAPSVPVDIGGVEARLGDANDGGRSIAWVTPEVGVEIRSEALTDDELVAFAKAMVEANR